jgi:gamma-glutamylcyclotransferase (GGCT)/AIG2-like uncharacterized protein YtfP
LYFVLQGTATIQGKLYDLGEYPAAIPTEENNFITGELYRIRRKEELFLVMDMLDEYEGMHVEPGEIPLFRRETVTVTIEKMTTVAWIYWYNREVEEARLIESGDYLKK